MDGFVFWVVMGDDGGEEVVDGGRLSDCGVRLIGRRRSDGRLFGMLFLLLLFNYLFIYIFPSPSP